MSRAVSNLLIVLTMAVVVTAILAFTSNGVRFDDAGPASLDAPAAEPDETAAETDTDDPPAETGDAAAGDEPATDDETSTAEAAAPEATTPDHLDPAPADDPAGAADTETTDDTETADDAGTDVLGATQVQEISTDELANTGPGLVAQWLVIATGIAATGGLLRNAGRDHADGELSLLP